jgi:acyl carrier protein
MEKLIIVEKVTEIFRRVFDNSSLVLNDEMTANDVENWTSLTNMTMMAEVEEVFGIRFKLKEIQKLHTVGDLIRTIETKL